MDGCREGSRDDCEAYSASSSSVPPLNEMKSQDLKTGMESNTKYFSDGGMHNQKKQIILTWKFLSDSSYAFCAIRLRIQAIVFVDCSIHMERVKAVFIC